METGQQLQCVPQFWRESSYTCLAVPGGNKIAPEDMVASTQVPLQQTIRTTRHVRRGMYVGACAAENFVGYVWSSSWITRSS